jgi:hypothetical protein
MLGSLKSVRALQRAASSRHSSASRHYSNDKQIHRRDVFVLDPAFGLHSRLLQSYDLGRSRDASVTRYASALPYVTC